MDSSKLCTCPSRLAMATVPNPEWCEHYNWAEALAAIISTISTLNLTKGSIIYHKKQGAMDHSIAPYLYYPK